MEWRPIESAPTDGRTVRVRNDGGEEDYAYWVPFTIKLNSVVPVRGLYNRDGEWSAEYGLGPFTEWKPETD